MARKPTDTDHIWPTSEGGPDEPWNIREISPHENRSKQSKMPDITDVFDSDDPIRLASEIDKYTINHEYKTGRNRNKGFGGLDRF